MSIDERTFQKCKSEWKIVPDDEPMFRMFVEAYEAAKETHQQVDCRCDVPYFTKQGCKYCGSGANKRESVDQDNGCPSCGAKTMWGFCPKSKSGKHYDEIEVGGSDE